MAFESAWVCDRCGTRKVFTEGVSATVPDGWKLTEFPGVGYWFCNSCAAAFQRTLNDFVHSLMPESITKTTTVQHTEIHVK